MSPSKALRSTIARGVAAASSPRQKPNAGAISTVFVPLSPTANLKGLRDFLNSHASHFSFTYESLQHIADLQNLDWRGVERVLFRTRNSDHWASGGAFDPNFVYLTGAGAKFLVEQKIRLVGIDSLGIEQFGNKDHPAHHALLQAGVTILEGLYLIDVPPGDYTLFCGPLRIVGSDGAPARAFLMR